MFGRSCWISASILAAVAATQALGARIRPGGDPRTDRVIWADPFDNYSQWAWNNRDNPAYQPQGTLWQGGPMPAGSATGTYPYKSDNGDPLNPYNGCGVVYQELPSLHYLAQQQWVKSPGCGYITTPGGDTVGAATFYAGPDNYKAGTNCTSGGWAETIAEFGRTDCVWQNESGYFTSLDIFTHDLAPRIQSWSPLRTWDQPNPNAVQGTDEHPLTFIFYLHDSGNPANSRAWLNNGYVELNLDDGHAPTDYIWRGNRDLDYDSSNPDPYSECCPQGPYPIICQQRREVNEGNYEQQHDLDYLNAHCPSLVPPYDPVTGTGKTWPAIAFGFLAIGCKDPCTCYEQGSGAHIPTMNHPMLFDGNVWRELRGGRGTALAQCPPPWVTDPATGNSGYEVSMQHSGSGACDNFAFGGGVHRVYLKLTTNKILIWMNTQTKADGVTTFYDYCGAFDRVYKGPFNRVAVGVGRGCELKDKQTDGDEYACKPGGTPTRCLTYSDTAVDGYWRTQVDSMSLLDGTLVYSTYERACCLPNGECVVTSMASCGAQQGVFRPDDLTCEASTCVGACCKGQVTGCAETTRSQCPQPFTFKGEGTSCATAICPCSTPFADADLDGDVDQLDFAAFQDCFTGPGGTASGTCDCFDREPAGTGDNDVDMDDLGKFELCASGPGIAVNAACDSW